MYTKFDSRILSTASTGLLALALAACGGGEGGPSTGDSLAPGGGGGTVLLVSGSFVDAPVNGLNYQGSGTTKQSGITGTSGTAGQFSVEQGDRVAFRLGGLLLGTSQPINASGRIVTPAELAGNASDFNDARAIRIARLLQSLDRDRNSGNGIELDAAIATRLASGAANTTSLQTALDNGTSFDTVLGGMIDELTAGNAGRAEGDLVSIAAAKAELAEAVAQATGSDVRDVVGGQPIVPATTAACPVGITASNRVTMFGQSFPVCVLDQDLTANVTLTNNHIYVLQKAIKVGNGDLQTGPTLNVTLTVEPGTQIFGYNGLQTGLIITRGSRLNAIGTPDLPIIFAAVEATGTGASVQITDDPADLTKRGQWAGVVLSGAGQDNFCTGSHGSGNLFSEASPTGSQRYFGCANNADNSGTVEYVVIAESGLGFRPDQEVQGLTLEGVGSGTRINFLQVLGSEDDGIEWFGGAASASNLVINGADDDGLDFDEGIQGTIQTALVIMGAANGDKGIEADNAGPNDDATPTSRINFVNVTVLGDVGSGGGSKGANFREGFGARVFRGVFVDASSTRRFGRGCLDFDNEVDEFTELRDVLTGCASGSGTGGVLADSNAVGTAFINTRTREDGTAPAYAVDFAAFTGSINAATLAIVAGATPDNTGTLPAAVNGNSAGNYFGAIDPASGNPDRDPNNNGTGGGPFWDGWTYINPAVDGTLPGATFHPLQREIQ